MTVNELIEKLQECNADDEVYIRYETYATAVVTDINKCFLGVEIVGENN